MKYQKRRVRRTFLAGILAGALAISIAKIPANLTELQATTIDDAKWEKQNLEWKRYLAQKELEEIEAQKDDLEAYIQALDEKQTEIEGRIEDLDNQIAEGEVELFRIQGNLLEAEKTVDSQYDIMKRRIKYMYENGTTDYIEIFVQAASVSDLLNQAEYMEKITEFDNNLLNRYHESVARVEEEKAAEEEQLQKLADMRAELEVEKESNEALTASKQEQLAGVIELVHQHDEEIEALDVSIDEQEQLIEELIAEAERKAKEEEERKRREEAERKAKEEAERLAREEAARRAAAAQNNYNNNNSGSSNSGGGSTGISANGIKFIWPMPSGHYISSGFGYRAEVMAGSGTFHSGIDIPVPTGTNIIAAASGTVVATSYHWSMGNYVMIDHGGGVYTIYMHCSSFITSNGAYVSQGQAIARVGSTGLATGPHLHFSIKVNGSYVNPLNYVSP